LVPQDTPFVGTELQVLVRNLPLDICLMTMGWQSYPAPLSLGALGMPGCSQHAALDGAALLIGQSGVAVWRLPIPDQAALVGVRFYNQALVLDPAVGNGFGAVVSDAAVAVVGRL
jgi:hypothetical protein